MKALRGGLSILGVCLGLFFFMVSEGFSFQIAEVVVREVIIKGNKRIEETAIRNRIKTRVGDVFDTDKLREDLRLLYRTGFFRDVNVDAEGFEGGVRVIFTVAEKPVIREIKIEGNKEIKIDKIREKIDLSLDAFVNRSAIAENARKIKQFYEEEGYYLAVVNYILTEIPERGVVVTFKIVENGEFKLKEVKFIGNEGIWSITMKLYLQNKEQFLYFLWGTLNKAEVEKDVERVKLLYLNKGYLDIKVDEPVIEVNEKEKAIYMTFKLTEGSRYKMGKVTVKGNAVFTEQDVLKAVKCREEKFYGRETVSGDITRITDKYSEKGYIYADVFPITSPDKEKTVVDVAFEIQEGKKAYLEKIEITGNIKTHDKVIRRQFRVAEREVYNAKEVKDARQRLLNLGFFEEINLNQLRGSAEDQVILRMDVKERPTGSFSVGGGVGSEGLFAQAEIVQGNLFGRGQRLALKGVLGQKVFLGELSFYEPFLLDTRISLNIDVYNTQRTLPEYTQRNTGGNLTFGFPIVEELRGSVGYRYDFIKIFDEQFTPDFWEQFVYNYLFTYDQLHGTRYWANKYDVLGSKDEIKQIKRVVDSIRKGDKSSTTSSVTVGLTRDTINNRLDPSEGQLFSAYATYAGPWLGGTNAFASYAVDYGIYVPLFWRLVYGFHTRFSYVQALGGRDTIPVSERLYLGGATTIRGFKPRDVGPKFDDRPIGGNKAWYVNNEITFPIYWTFRGAVFFDVGNVWLENQDIDLSGLRTGAGVGLRFLSPIGPIRLDYGFNLAPKGKEPIGQFHFLVGSFF